MPGHIQADITILGAGPAGITAALQLGKEGIPCLLIDAGHSPKDKICGDGLSGKVLHLLKKIDPEYCDELGRQPFVTPSRAVRFVSPKQQMAEIFFHNSDPALPAGFICKRRHFDHFLLEKALAFPSLTFIPDIKISSIVKEEGHILLSEKDGEIRVKTRLLLMATGSHRNAFLSGFPGYPPMEGEGIGIRTYFDHVSGCDENYAIEIHFLKELLPWYLWIFPFKDGSANVGLALPLNLAKKQGLSLKKLLFELLGKYPGLNSRFSGSAFTGKVEAHRLPFYHGRHAISGDNFMLLGDAAYLIDPFTGEGISHAMISGYLAAKTAKKSIEENDFSSKNTIGYEESVYNELGPELDLGLRLQELARSPRLLNLVIGKASKSKKVRNLLEEMLYNINTKGKLSQPMFYLKLALGLK